MLNTEVEYKSDFRFSNAYTKMKSASERSKTKCRSQCQSDGLLQLIQIENIQLGTEYIMFTIHHYTGNLFLYRYGVYPCDIPLLYQTGDG